MTLKKRVSLYTEAFLMKEAKRQKLNVSEILTEALIERLGYKQETRWVKK